MSDLIRIVVNMFANRIVAENSVEDEPIVLPQTPRHFVNLIEGIRRSYSDSNYTLHVNLKLHEGENLTVDTDEILEHARSLVAMEDMMHAMHRMDDDGGPILH